MLSDKHLSADQLSRDRCAERKRLSLLRPLKSGVAKTFEKQSLLGVAKCSG